MGSRTARIAGAVATGLFAASLLAGGGCELAVGDAVPLFLCEPGVGTCPSSQVCSPSTHRCVPAPQACTLSGCPDDMQCDDQTLACVPVDSSLPGDGAASEDATVGFNEAEAEGPATDAPGAMTDASAPVDEDAAPDASTAEAAARCHGTIGCACSTGRDCNGGLCVTQPGSVTRDIWSAARRRPFCSKTCCTSNDCDDGSICFATAAGGNYCVPASWLNDRTAPGLRMGGEECTQGGECRSGLCPAGTCADTCCSGQSAAQCGPGSACRFGDFPGLDIDTHHTAHCSPQQVGGSANGADCASNGACRSNLCISAGGGFVTCHDACRSSADCVGQNQVCSYIASGNTSEVFAACVSANGAQAGNTVQQGSACRGATDCQSGLCDLSGQCTDVCFADSDCTFGTWHCRPSNMPILGGGGGTYWVLTCGP